MSAMLRRLIGAANREFCDFLSTAGQDGVVSAEDFLTADRIQVLAKRLQQVEELLGPDPLPAQQAAEMEREFAEYVENLEGLKLTLEAIGCRLLVRRAQLETERAHLTAAGAWAASCREAS